MKITAEDVLQSVLEEVQKATDIEQVIFARAENFNSLPPRITKAALLTLRDEGLVVLAQCWDEDGQLSGSGYMTTIEGQNLAKQLAS